MPLTYWGEAFVSAAYLINRAPSSTINFQTPFQALADAIVTPTVPNLPPRVFGCVAFVHLHKHHRNKLTPRALRECSSSNGVSIDLLHDIGMSACQLANTLVEEWLKLSVETNQIPAIKGRYHSLVG